MYAGEASLAGHCAQRAGNDDGSIASDSQLHAEVCYLQLLCPAHDPPCKRPSWASSGIGNGNRALSCSIERRWERQDIGSCGRAKYMETFTMNIGTYQEHDGWTPVSRTLATRLPGYEIGGKGYPLLFPLGQSINSQTSRLGCEPCTTPHGRECAVYTSVRHNSTVISSGRQYLPQIEAVAARQKPAAMCNKLRVPYLTARG
ncbi:hypothetical protein GE09DRAFT_632934 [Coniochaeta sp. 2T2.1]|nr:hypothetical protein GE09DRAFT_632934 [Coniochaeta sp. 2T2.1]